MFESAILTIILFSYKDISALLLYLLLYGLVKGITYAVLYICLLTGNLFQLVYFGLA